MNAADGQDAHRRVRHLLLDRDGVLNREHGAGWLADPADWRWEVGARTGLRRLARAGIGISVVTNQSGIGRGVVTAEQVAAVHRHLRAELADLGFGEVDVLVCPHHPDDGCPCRKPRPALVLEALGRAGVSAAEALLVGDAARDLAAGRAAGVAVVLVRTGKGATTLAELDPTAPAPPTVADLDELADLVLGPAG